MSGNLPSHLPHITHMKNLSIVVGFAILFSFNVYSQELHALLESKDFGFGEGVALQETKRESDISLFKITRNYDYKKTRSTAWSIGHGWFVACALRQVAIERGFERYTRKYRVMDGDGALRPFKNGEQTWDIEPDQFYVIAEWVQGHTQEDVSKLLQQGIIPANDPKMAKLCEDFLAKGKAR